MKLRTMTLSLSMLLSLTACSQPAPPPAAEATTPAASAPPATPTPPSGDNQELNQAIQQPLDKARAVEGQLQEGREANDAKLEEQGG